MRMTQSCVSSHSFFLERFPHRGSMRLNHNIFKCDCFTEVLLF